MSSVDKVQIWNYKSISKSGWIPLSDDFSTLIGPNGAGKSNILKSLTLIGDKKEIPVRSLCRYKSNFPPDDLTDIPIISVIFSDISGSIMENPFRLSDIELFSDIDDKIDYNINKDVSTNKMVVTKFKDGSLRIYLGEVSESISEQDIINNSISPEEFIENRIYDLTRISANLINELSNQYGLTLDKIGPVEISNLDEYLNTPDDHITYLTELSNSISEQTDEEYLDDSIGSESVPVEESDKITISTIQEEIDRLSSTLIELQNNLTNPIEEIPFIFSSTQINPLPDRVEFRRISEVPPYQGFFDAAGVNPDRLISIDQQNIESRIEKGAERLTELYNIYWEIDQNSSEKGFPESSQSKHYSISADIGESSIGLYMTGQADTKLPINDRSTGERWILSFLLTVVHQVGDDDQDGLVILDDPGVHLHPHAQELLLQSIIRLSSKKQVVYSTHSPFLIDNERLDKINIVKHSGDSGTKIHTKLGPLRSEGDMGSLSPVRRSLGAEMALLPFGSSLNILVEGYTDRLYLETINTYLKDTEERQGLPEEVGLIDVEGTKFTYMSKFLKSESLQHVFLLDDDADTTRENLISGGVDGDKISFLGDMTPSSNADIAIEDLLPRSILCEAVIEHQSEDISKEILESEIESSESNAINAISRKLHQLEQEGTLSNKVFDKGDIADSCCRKLRKRMYNDEIEEEFIDRAESLFEDLYSLFGSD